MSWLLVVCVTLSVAIPSPSIASAFSGSGSGTEEDPYLISTLDQLLEMNSDLNAHYKLVNDIDLGVAPYNAGEGWQPLGYLHGSLDGNGHTIRNMMINRPSTNELGLFGRISNATIKNLILENVDISGGGNIGGVVGVTFKGTLSNITVTGRLAGRGSIGGLVGSNNGASLTDVVFYGHVQGNIDGTLGMASGANVGSIVGYHSDYDGSNATIQNAYAFGAVQAQSYFGGIAGYNDGRIQNAYAFHDKFLHNDNMMKTVNFGKIATALGASGVTESVYSTPVTVPPTGYAFGEDASLNGQPMDGTLLLAAKTGIEGILGDSTVKNDIGAILDAQATWATYATPGFTGEDSAGSVTQNLTLPSVGVGTASLFWYTTRPDLVASDGTINRPKGGANVSVRLTATVTGAVYSGGSFSYSRLSDVTVWKAPPAVRRAVMFPGHDEIVIDFEQPYVSVDASKIEVSVDGSPIAATPAYTGNRMTLQLAIEPSTDATVEVTLLEGAVTDSNGEVNALDTRAVEPLVVVSFDDPDLESAIREQLGIPSPNPILSTDMETLYSLYAQYRGISDLTGLEYAVNLEQLDLSGNTGIADFAPLQALTSLNELNFGDAGLTDIDWIPSLSSLRTLYIWDNEIENITPLLTLYNNGGLQSGYRVIDVKGNPLQIVNEESPNMIVVRKLQSYEIEVRFDREYEEQFVLKQRKGVVGPEEFVEIIVSKTTLGHDVSSFDFILSMNPYVWTPVGYAPADGASGILELGWEEEEEGGIRIAGTFVEGQEPEGATDLVKLYLKSSAMSESPYIAAAAFGEGGEEELPPIPIPPYWAFGIRDAYTVDSLGVERYTVPALVGFVPPSSPDVDRNGIVNAVDVELVSAVFGKTDEDFESTDEFDSLDMNWNGVIDMDDITFVYMRSKVPGFDPDAPGDDMIPFDIDWELPE